MKTMFLAAAAALGLGIGSAYADEGEGTIANTFHIPGVVAQAPAPKAPATATAQNGQVIQAYITQSGRGTWLFPPNENGNG